MQKLFIISDIHGHYTVMKQALQDAGFNADDETHHLLCLGDLFDRGTQNAEVYEYMKTLHDKGKASCILGNHDLFLLEFLEGDFSSATFNAQFNGFDKTLESFSGMAFTNTDIETIHERILKRYPSLYDWLVNRPLFIEHDDYIFAHGGIDLTYEDWRQQPRNEFVWNYQSTLQAPDDKIVVVGHERTPMIRRKWNIENHSNSTILYHDNVIFIDAFVEKTQRINVLNLTLQKPLKNN